MKIKNVTGKELPDDFCICRDEDCPKCGWPETFVGALNGKPDHVGCRKCGWREQL